MSKVHHITRETPSKGAVERRPSFGTLMPFEEMERMFDRFFEGFGFGPRRLRPFHWDVPSRGEFGGEMEPRFPRVDMIDRDNDILVRAELPGVEKKDLDVSMSDNMLTIHGATHFEEKEARGEYQRGEIRHGEFHRTLSLPVEVDGEKVKAKFENGILELTLSKLETAKRRTIKVE